MSVNKIGIYIMNDKKSQIMCYLLRTQQNRWFCLSVQETKTKMQNEVPVHESGSKNFTIYWQVLGSVERLMQLFKPCCNAL